MFRLGKKNFRRGNPPPSPGIARTCYGYAAGGTPLTFTQEDFLVFKSIQPNSGRFPRALLSITYFMSISMWTTINARAPANATRTNGLILGKSNLLKPGII